jgi:S1-C subfamily serine protease
MTSHDSLTTAPCPQCLESAPLVSTECHRCGSSLLVDVLAPPVADPRLRYVVGRDLSVLGAPLPAFFYIQAALQPPGGLLARQASRAEAARILEALAAHQLAGRTRPSGDPSPAPAPPIEYAAHPPPRHGARWALATAGIVGLIVLVSVVVTVVRRARANEPPPLAYTELAERGRRSTVVLTSGTCQGSGFFVAPDLLLTNAHVLCADEVDAHVGGARMPGTILNLDEELDLALVKAEGAHGTPLPLADAMELAPGDLVVAAGAPLGNEGTVVKGTVARHFVAIWGVLHVEANAAVNPGNSGGPLLNDRGQVVGVVSKSRVLGERRWALALPVNYAADWLPGAAGMRGRQWEAKVADAARAAEPEVRHFSAALDRPMLLGARYLQTNGGFGAPLVFVVAAPASYQDSEPARLTVRLTCGDTRPKATTLSTWVPLDGRLERSPRLDVNQLQPFLAWARKRAVTQRLVVGSGETMITPPHGCAVPKLALLDGTRVADTVEIE